MDDATDINANDAADMNDAAGIAAAEQAFFRALREADLGALEEVLAADFLLIDVMTGSEVPRESLLALVGSGQLRFAAIELVGSRVRAYGAAAVVTGRTRITGSFQAQAFEVSSRYTHVYVRQADSWRLVAAQGTQIAEA